MKKTECTPLKNALLTAAYWLLQCLGGFLSFLVMFAGIRDTGSSDGSGFLPVSIYKVNPFCYVIGALLSLALFAVIWFYLLRRTWIPGRHWHPVWTVVWVLEMLLAFAAIFLIYMFVMILMCKGDLFSTIRPEWLEYFIFVYAAAGIILIIADGIRLTKQFKKDN